MPRSMVALLAAVATAMLALAALAHGALFLGIVADAVFANGLSRIRDRPSAYKKKKDRIPGRSEELHSKGCSKRSRLPERPGDFTPV